MSERSFEIGPIRPPSEASSLLLQVTRGCTWNKCRFCTVYRGSGFQMIQPEEIRKNIDNMAYFRDLLLSCSTDEGIVDKAKLYGYLENFSNDELQCFYMIYNWLSHGGKSVFLQDGNSIALKPEKLAGVLVYLREKFPHIERVTTYGRAETMSRWSEEQWRLLHQSGLNRIHTGFESGSDNVLKLIHKGLTQEQEIDGGRKVKAAGLELSVYFMPGIGGVEFHDENAEETAYVVNQIDPDFVRLRTFVLKLESEMYDMEKADDFSELTDIEKLQEIRKLIEKIDRPDVTVVSDHIVNLVGSLNHPIRRKGEMLAKIDEVLRLPEREQKIYQLARRHGVVEEYSHLRELPKNRIEHFGYVASQYTDPEVWESHLNGILRQYV